MPVWNQSEYDSRNGKTTKKSIEQYEKELAEMRRKRKEKKK